MDNLSYSQRGDYLLPDLILSEQPTDMLGRYGLMRRHHLESRHPILYNSLLLKGRLHAHLLEIEKAMTERMELMMTELILTNPPPDKAQAQMAWAAHMNSLRQQVEEQALSELIYS